MTPIPSRNQHGQGLKNNFESGMIGPNFLFVGLWLVGFGVTSLGQVWLGLYLQNFTQSHIIIYLFFTIVDKNYGCILFSTVFYTVHTIVTTQYIHTQYEIHKICNKQYKWKSY